MATDTPPPLDLLRDTLAITPDGLLRVEGPGRPRRYVSARRNGSEDDALGSVLLALTEVDDSGLTPPLAFGRRIAMEFLRALAARGEAQRNEPLPPVRESLQRLFSALPPMKGMEYADIESVSDGWTALDVAVRIALRSFPGTVHEYLQQRNSALNARGRITFHLAEQKPGAEAPFAFLATYVEEGPDGRERHVPLGRALARPDADKAELLRLLRPVHAAIQRSVFVQKLWDAGGLHHALPWGLEEAYAFLLAVPDCEAAGVTVRVPDWWRSREQRKVRATARVGSGPPSMLGLEALLDFEAGLTLDGERLTATEERELLSGARGLRLIRGRMVEVDPEQLQQAVTLFGTLAERAQRGDLPLGDALRLLSGASELGSNARDLDGLADTSIAEWSGVEAGPWLQDLLTQLAAPESSPATDPGPALHATLRPYQRQGVAWLSLLARLQLGACLADDMGLGKTIQVIALMLVLARDGERGPHLLVLPTSLLGNWQAELARFAPTLRVFVAHRSEVSAAELADPQLADVDVVLTTYGTLPSLDWAKNTTFGLLVLDEAQAIKNPGTRQSKSVKTLHARARIGLTGTPVENRLGDLWSLFDFLNPGLLGSAWEFSAFAQRLDREDGPGYGPLRQLLRPYILRRMKSDPEIAPDLPAKTEMQVLCGLAPVQVALYEATVKELADSLTRSLESEASEIQRRGLVLASLLRLKQICDHPSLWLHDGVYAPTDSGKFQRLAELCEVLAERQERALVFTQFRQLTGPLDTFLAGCFGRPGLVLHGGTPAKRRAALVAEFQESDGPPYMVLSLKAGGTGLNLTAASQVIHFDRWWNPAVENQATDRAFRIGQKRNVLVHAFTCRGTIEERIDELLRAKKNLADGILASSGEAALTELSSEELLRLVRLDVRHAEVRGAKG